MKRLLRYAPALLLFSSAFCRQSVPSIQSLAWLSGCWEARPAGGRVISEQWMKPLGNVMLGTSRTVNKGKTVGFEFVRLEQAADGIIRYIAHPSGQREAAFTLIKLENGRATFENPSHDFPQRIIYHLVSRDSLIARIEGRMEGKTRSADFPYRRVSCEPD